MRRAAPLPQRAALGVVAGAWALVAGLYASGLHAALDHHRLEGGGAPLWISALVILGMWQVMTAAMMLPSCLPAVRYVTRSSLAGRQGRAVLGFLVAYFAVWTVFGLAATLADVALHHLAAATSAPARLPFVVALLAASLWQLTPVKRAFLVGCRTGVVLAASGRRADAACLRFGLRYGASCLGSCWALMLVMFAAGAGSPAWMVLLAALVWAEKTHALGRDLARPSAVALGILALAVARF